MKSLIIIFFTTFILTFNSFAFGEFCEGYKAGYKQGYKSANNTPINPIPPICPIKPIKGFGDPQSDYEFGYVEGLKEGMSAR